MACALAAGMALGHARRVRRWRGLRRRAITSRLTTLDARRRQRWRWSFSASVRRGCAGRVPHPRQRYGRRAPDRRPCGRTRALRDGAGAGRASRKRRLSLSASWRTLLSTRVHSTFGVCCRCIGRAQLAALVGLCHRTLRVVGAAEDAPVLSAAKKQEMGVIGAAGACRAGSARRGDAGCKAGPAGDAQGRRAGPGSSRGRCNGAGWTIRPCSTCRASPAIWRSSSKANSPHRTAQAQRASPRRAPRWPATLKREDALKAGKSPRETKGAAGKQADLKGAQPNDSDAMKLSHRLMRDFGKSLELQDPGGQENALRNLADQLQSGQLKPQERPRSCRAS